MKLNKIKIKQLNCQKLHDVYCSKTKSRMTRDSKMNLIRGVQVQFGSVYAELTNQITGK